MKDGSAEPRNSDLTFGVVTFIPHFIAGPHSLLQCFCMTTQQKVEALIRAAAELPAEAQAELLQSLVEMHAEHVGIYHVDDEERAALARSAEDVRLGRFASDESVEAMFGRHRGA
jgi:hypothetical protein